MSYITNIKFRSFSFYNTNYRKQFISGRNETGILNNEAETKVLTTRWEGFWRKPQFKKNYSLKQNY